MCVLLRDLQARAPVRFELVAVHLDQGQPGYDGTPLAEWLAAEGIPHKLLHENTYAIVTDKIPEGNTYCSLCSRLRRGILYRAAADLGCNKIALGHHRDDSAETLLLNLFFAGTLRGMPPILRSDDGRNTVIRPMCYVEERDLIAYAAEQRYPVVKCGCPTCGLPDQKRQVVKRWLSDLAAEHPGLKTQMLAAMQNVRPGHLLDKSLLSRLVGPADSTDRA